VKRGGGGGVCIRIGEDEANRHGAIAVHLLVAQERERAIGSRR
jgi:hypothetical protein